MPHSRIKTKPEQQVRRLERALLAVTRCGQALVRASDEHHLMQEICDIIVESGYRFVWVGIAEQDGERLVSPVAWSGHEEGYLSCIKVTWSDSTHGRGPVGTAIRTGKPKVVQNVTADPNFDPWYEQANKRGYRSTCALPLLTNGTPFGSVAIYAEEADAFDELEMKLFQTFAETLSYGITALRTEQERLEVHKLFVREEEEKKKLIAVVQNSPDFIAITDPSGQVVFVNRAGQELIGLANSALTSPPSDIVDYLPSEERPRLEDEILPVILSGRSWHGETALKHFITNERIPVDTRAFAIHDEQGKIIGLANVSDDIRQRKQQEQLLRQAEEKYREIFENAVVGIFQRTPEGRYLSVNPALARMTGYESPEKLVAEVTDIGAQLYVDPSQCDEIERILQQHGVVRNIECEIYRKDRRRLWLSQNTRVVRDASGKILYYEGTVEDITERKILEKQLRQAQRLEAVGRLAGGVAHDFNNMLGIIIGYCELLQSKIGPNSLLQGDVANIRKAADGAATLTRQLLAFSRRQVFQLRAVDLNAILNDVSKMLRRVIGDDVDLIITPGAKLGMVKADPGQIEQVMMNLAVNARDAMPDGGKLILETSNAELDESYARRYSPVRAGHYVMLTVSDSGCGMTAETLSHIFEPFFTTKELGKGTGLGLSIVYGIVEQSGGYIWAYSEVGRGTTFKIYFPLTSEPAEQATPSKAPVRVGGSETILVVEDEPDLCEIARLVLKADGYDVICAHFAEEAMRLAESRTGPIHLLLTDVVLKGGVNGFELAKSLRGSRPGLGVLYMSGYSSELVSGHGIPKSETSQLLLKPFTADSLRLKVREIIDARGTLPI